MLQTHHLHFQGPKPGEQTPAADVKPSTPPGSSTAAGVSTDENRNYAVLAGTVAAACGLGWYLLSKPKKSAEVSDWSFSVVEETRNPFACLVC